jgi:chromosomal replication initiation ATPase DnaA
MESRVGRKALRRRSPRRRSRVADAFDTFAAGPSTQLAFAASQAAASRYPRNTLRLLCGGVGLGKTHLLHSIGHQQLATLVQRSPPCGVPS